MLSPNLESLRVDLGHFRITHADLDLAMRILEKAIEARDPQYFCFCEANMLASALRDPCVAQLLDQARAVFPDGIALLWLARALGHRLPARVPGPSFMLAACERGVSRGWRHYFYGGEPGVAAKLVRRLKNIYPGLAIAGFESPPFHSLTRREESGAVDRIQESEADIVWVGLGSPKQERWCADHFNKLNVPVLLPVGAAFDFHTGNRPWAPAWIRKLGMEWFFRSLTGGRRTFLRNIRCVSAVAWHIATVALRRTAEGSGRKPPHRRLARKAFLMPPDKGCD